MDTHMNHQRPIATWREAFELVRNGVSVDFGLKDEPSAVCPACEGKGVVSYDVPIDDPRFGKLFRCPEPDCPAVAQQRHDQVEKVMKNSTWEDNYRDLTFESFRLLIDGTHKGQWEGKRGAYAVSLFFASNGGKPFTLDQAAMGAFTRKWPNADTRKSNSVVLMGDVGLGKTGLAIAAGNELRRRGEVYVFIRTMQLIRNIQDTYSRPENAPEGSTVYHYRLYSTVPYLILDEFGIKNFSRDRLEIVETIIRDRDRAGLPTLITTNLSLEQLSDTELWDKQIGDIVKKAHCITVAGVKLRDTASKEAAW
jgi:hypothetical protein